MPSKMVSIEISPKSKNNFTFVLFTFEVLVLLPQKFSYIIFYCQRFSVNFILSFFQSLPILHSEAEIE